MPTGHASNIFQHLLHHIPWCNFVVTQPLEDRARLNFSLGHRVSSLWRMPRMYTIYGRAPFCDARILRSHLTAALVKHHGLNATKKKRISAIPKPLIQRVPGPQSQRLQGSNMSPARLRWNDVSALSTWVHYITYIWTLQHFNPSNKI